MDDKRGLASYRRLELLLGIRLSEPVQLRGVILQEHVGLQGLLVHFQLGFMKTPAKAREIRRRRRRGGWPGGSGKNRSKAAAVFPQIGVLFGTEVVHKFRKEPRLVCATF